MRIRITAIATTLALAVAALVIGTPAPALALPAPDAVVVTSPPSPTTSDPLKVVTAICPFGTVVVGAGGEIPDGRGKVALVQVMPDLATRSVRVTAAATEPNVPPWSVTASAVCSPAPAGIAEHLWYSAVTSEDKERTVECPDGKALLGFGYSVIDGGGQIMVTKLAPNGTFGSAANKVTVAAHERAGVTTDWRLIIDVICADGVPGQQVLSNSSPTDAAQVKSVNMAPCPTNQHATAGGFEAVPLTAGLDSAFVVVSIRPVTTRLLFADRPVNMIPTAYKDPSASTDWKMSATVLCV
jgi:hypothetical protein